MLFFAIIRFKTSTNIFSEFNLKKLLILTTSSISKISLFSFAFFDFFLFSIASCIKLSLFAADIISKGVCLVVLCFFLKNKKLFDLNNAHGWDGAESCENHWQKDEASGLAIPNTYWKMQSKWELIKLVQCRNLSHSK